MILFWLTIWLPFAWAGPAAPKILAQDKPVVWTSGFPSSAAEYFPPDKYQVLNREVQNEDMAHDGYLPPHRRDALFRKVGIETRIGALDELDKDMLVMGARSYSVAELKKQYPMLTQRQLTALKREIGRLK